ncbi:MAG: T9SS type A sorting domain-containing protein [Chitinophagaceae bacterium]|jgi:hypothetical protein
MKLKLYLLCALAFAAMQEKANAQTAADYGIQVQASVQISPAKVTLNWRKIPGATQYNLLRKTKAAMVWTTLATTADTFYTDASVVADSAFEYKITNTGGSTAAGGYIYAGLNAPAIHNRGTLVLLVDTLFADSCANEISGLMKDLSGDGWAIVHHNVKRTLADTAVKSMIKKDYDAISDVKAVLIAGHIAVPYSGELAPDGHSPDHVGAWAADVYYADMDYVWTDVSVNNTGASRAQTKNIPGDGKWDHSAIPTYLELQVSRIDVSNMPSFAKSEVAMMKSYLAKAHNYKINNLYISRKAVVDDNFGAFSGEAFAANAWRNFPALITRNNIIAGDFISTLNDSAYQWAYGCGGGSYTSCGGVGNTADFLAKKQKGIFTMMFGSYFGDWDNQNNFLRAPLCCDEPALTSCWAGRPNWFFHHMALGENIGYSAFVTQNNATAIYTPYGFGTGGVHVGLMGDLSLRTDYIKPAGSIAITSAPIDGATVNWTASPEAGVIGYYVYRADSMFGKYNKVSSMIVGTSFKDLIGKDGLYYYMVRPVKLQSTPSGTYYNLGLGVTDSATISFPFPVSIAAAAKDAVTMICFPNPATEIVNVYGNLNSAGNTATISILDISGKVIAENEHKIQQNEFTISENLSTFAAGTYFVQLKMDNKTMATQKIIKK